MDTAASPRRAVDQSLVARVVGSYIKKKPAFSSGHVGAHPALSINRCWRWGNRLNRSRRPQRCRIRRSVTRDHLVCLECGRRGDMLRRYIQVRHGLSTVGAAISSCPSCAGLLGEAIEIAKQLSLGKHLRQDLLPSQPDQPGGEDKPRQTPPPDPAFAWFRGSAVRARANCGGNPVSSFGTLGEALAVYLPDLVSLSEKGTSAFSIPVDHVGGKEHVHRTARCHGL
jgi:hypothetical protein